MGTWGARLYSDDLAKDVRESVRDAVGDGLDGAAAVASALREYGSSATDMDEGPTFWFALADTLWNVGRLPPWVRDHAVALLDRGADLHRWTEPTLREKRASELRTLRERLTSPMAPPKRVPRRFRNTCPWEPGEVVAYRLPSDRYVPMLVCLKRTDKGGVSPVVVFFDWTGITPPTDSDLAGVPLRHAPVVGDEASRPFCAMLGGTSAREYPAERLVRTGIRLERDLELRYVRVILWRFMDTHLEQALGLR